MVSTALTDTASAVWLTRLTRPSLLTDWFNPERRTAETSNGPVVSFATDDGFTVCVKGDMAAMGRRQRGRSILREVYNNLTTEGDAAKSMERAPHYRDLAVELEPGVALTAYLSTGGAKNASLAPWSPVTIERVLVGAYNDAGSLHLAARGYHGEKSVPPSLHRAAVEAFQRLPSTAIAAMAFHTDQFGLEKKSGPIHELITLMRSISRSEDPDNESEEWQSKIGDIGPELLAVWGQSSSLEHPRQQLGLLIRCRDARAVRSDVSRILSEGIRWVGQLDGVEDEELLPKFKLTSHLGTPIVYIAPSDYAARSKLSWLPLLRHSTPAWAAWGDWFMMTNSLEYMQQLLDAQNGIIPTLATVPEVQRHLSVSREYAGLGMLQPALVGAALEKWSHELESLPETHWINALWSDTIQFAEGSEDRLWLDAFEFAGQRGAGTASVARIDAEAGKVVPLQVGDLVIGLNDRLLTLTDPLGTLEEVWDSVEDNQILKVRIIRSGKALEVEIVPRSLERTGVNTFLDSPAQAARKAAELMDGVTFTGWSWQFAAEQRFSADVVITCTADKP